MKPCFITTTDEETRKQLIAEGFEEIKNASGVFTFVNKPISFENSDIDITKIKYDNMLCI